MQAYFISRKGYQEGPHSLELIEDKIKSGYLDAQDYIYDSKSGEWTWLSRFSLTQPFFEKSEITEPIDNSKFEENWYLLKDQNQLGPYSYQEIISMLLEKKAFEYDYVWTAGMDAWQRVSECAHFEEDKLKKHLANNKNIEPTHFRRRSARFDHVTSLVFHNNKKLWNGKAFELSASGASVQVEGQAFKKGELLLLHCRPAKEVPAFNVQCEVISCQKVKSESGSGLYRLGLRFVKINVVAQKAINKIAYNQVAS